MQRGRKASDVFPEAIDGGDAMPGVVKPLGEDDEALMEGGRKPCHA
ncbi:hypothetical protein ACVWZV_009365 [Bradyrhizobium sp. GM5.1]